MRAAVAVPEARHPLRTDGYRRQKKPAQRASQSQPSASSRWRLPLINGAASGDTINVPVLCTITLLGAAGEDANATGDLDITKTLTIVGSSAAGTLISGGAGDRVFHVNGSGITLSLSNLSVISGNPGATADGGGILLTAGAVSLNNVIVRSNTAKRGGGAYVAAGTLTANNSTFGGAPVNSAEAGGGVLVASGATATFTPVFVLPDDDASISTAGTIGSGGGGVACGIFLVSAGPGAVGDRTVFRCETVDPPEESSARVPLFYSPIWHVVEIVAQDSAGGQIAQFTPPLSICAYYSSDHLADAGGDPNRLVIYTAPGSSNTWTAIETTAEPDALRVCATTGRLSRFRLLAKPDPRLEQFSGGSFWIWICVAAFVIVLFTTFIFVIARAIGGRGKKQPAKP